MLVLLFGIACCGALAYIETDDSKTIRLAIVITPKTSGLIDFLAEDFEKKTGQTVEVTVTNRVYERALNGKADIVISHYGKSGLERFVLDRHGIWPKMVFSNQAAIIGPQSDPAGIRSLASAPEALARIAATQSPLHCQFNSRHELSFQTSIGDGISGRFFLCGRAWSAPGPKGMVI
jgi:tungstate transport system substrate-binding protein